MVIRFDKWKHKLILLKKFNSIFKPFTNIINLKANTFKNFKINFRMKYAWIILESTI